MEAWGCASLGLGPGLSPVCPSSYIMKTTDTTDVGAPRLNGNAVCLSGTSPPCEHSADRPTIPSPSNGDLES
ncbi:hypothetical protein FB451DRAFT_1397683 [Mycena latifolia]|nr:hypothetical protein FB451DRAFT_1397683 [Mycena latifolia]